MNIYLLIEDWFGGNSIIGCFSTIEKAEIFIKNTGRPRSNFSIKEMELK